MDAGGTIITRTLVRCPVCKCEIDGLTVVGGSLVAGEAVRVLGYVCPSCKKAIHWGKR